MSNIWEPEMEVTIQLVTEIIEKQFPQLAPISINYLGQGFDFTVFVINECFVFRFPRREEGRICLEVEKDILKGLSEKLPLLPKVKFLGSPCKEFSSYFIGLTYMDGVTVANANLSNEARITLATSVANFLKTLHYLPVSSLSQLDLPKDRHDRFNMEKNIPILLENLKKIKELQLLENTEDYEKFLKKLHSPEKDTLVFVHGDFSLTNVLVRSSGKLSGVIDWGDAHVGNRAVDLSFIHLTLHEEAKQKFLSIYGKVNNETWMLSIFRALFINSFVILYAEANQQEVLLLESLHAFTLLKESINNL
jgi:aminoglycoside phosphotransferase (APT) family kinase protein